ncbi:hypothetical protein FP744_10000145 [Trichoderma asperellum]|nr:hypothetical protein LI328DRAFT_163954 [Trichoderma asperelloides]
MLRPWRSGKVEAPNFGERYESLIHVDASNPQMMDQYNQRFSGNFTSARQIVAQNETLMNQGDSLSIYENDRYVPTANKLWVGMNFVPRSGIPSEPGSLSKLATAGKNVLSIQTRIVDRCLSKAEDYQPKLNSGVLKMYQKQAPEYYKKRKQMMYKDRANLDDVVRKGEEPSDDLLRRLLYNGFNWKDCSPNKKIRNRFSNLSQERQANRLLESMETASPRSYNQFVDMLNRTLGVTGPSKEKSASKMGKFISGVGETAVDTALEMLGDEIQTKLGNWMVMLPVLGPAPDPTPPVPESDVFEWLIQGHEQRGIPPPTYEDLKAGEKELQNILQTLRQWLTADQKTFWRDFRPRITTETELVPNSEAVPESWVEGSDDSKLKEIAVSLAEQVQISQVHLLWAERIDSGKHPWVWEVNSDKTSLVEELCRKYLDEGAASMYDYVGTYSYRGKKPLSRLVACSLVSEALENILAAVADIHDEGLEMVTEDK